MRDPVCVPSYVCMCVCMFALVLHRLMERAKEMMQESLPIKCLEAAVLGLYLSMLWVHVCMPFCKKRGQRSLPHPLIGTHAFVFLVRSLCY